MNPSENKADIYNCFADPAYASRFNNVFNNVDPISIAFSVMRRLEKNTVCHLPHALLTIRIQTFLRFLCKI